MTVERPKLFRPLSDKQIVSFQDSNAKINIWEGAVRSGKTYVSLIRFVDELINGPPGLYAIVTRTFDSFRRNLLETLMEMSGGDAKFYYGKREFHLWGKTVSVIGADDARAENKIRGSSFAGAYVDEITLVPESMFNMLISRCAMKGARIFGTTNPDTPYHWLKKNFLDNNRDVYSWQFTVDDNPALTKEDKEYLKRQYKGLWFKRFIEGLWVQAEGAVYDFFDCDDHCILSPPGLAEYFIVGIDYGTSNACAFTLIGVNRTKFPNVWVEKEYYYDSKAHQRQKTDSEYGHDFRKFIEGKNVTGIFIDPSAASFKIELLRQGVRNLFDANNEVLDGIRFVGDMIANGTLKVCQGCVNLIKEFQSYVWDARSEKMGIDKPLKQNDHGLDSLRYAIFTHFFNKTENKIDWEKAYREATGAVPQLPRFFSDPIGGEFGNSF